MRTIIKISSREYNTLELKYISLLEEFNLHMIKQLAVYEERDILKKEVQNLRKKIKELKKQHD